MNYYNEHDVSKAAWLRELIKQGHISKGEVDERDIKQVNIGDFRGFKQCHFFAGIGVWSYALRLAGWPDDRPIWTASCPCQPFSQAGAGGGTSDPRHLWPTLSILIQLGQPPMVIGEQVSSQDGLAWFDLVSDDLEREAYTVWAIDTTAAGIGAGHVRNRLYWAGGLADTASEGRTNGNGRGPDREPGQVEQPERLRSALRLANTHSTRLEERGRITSDVRPQRKTAIRSSQACDWVLCRPGRSGDGYSLRPTEPGAFPLANGVAKRVGLLRGYGDAINANQAAAFIESLMVVV